jgi:hypothetical protein
MPLPQSGVYWASSDALIRRLQEIQDAGRPGSTAIQSTKKDIKRIIEDDHKGKMLRGVDRYGKPRAPLAPGTLTVKRGSGPSLIPRGLNSRFVTNFETLWTEEGGYRQLVGHFRPILSKKGKEFAHYHLTGAVKAGTNWVLPKRDVGGITPKGWYRIIQRHKQLPDDFRKFGGGR